MTPASHLGFPAPLLGMQSVRLPVLFDDGEVLALAKPAGILVQKDSWYPRLPVLIEAIRYQAERGKPEFQRAGIGESGLWAVHDLDPDCSGPVLLARSRNRAESLANAYGSLGFRFTFELLTLQADGPDEATCDLPLARHIRLARMLVSHTTGKAARTSFTRGERVGAFARAQAVTPFPRRHQILIHGKESGFPVLGDRFYARSNPPLLSDLKHDYRSRPGRDEQPLYPGPAYFLRSLEAGPAIQVEAPSPARWDGLQKQLARYS